LKTVKMTNGIDMAKINFVASILLDLERIKYPYSGLGHFCSQLALHLPALCEHRHRLNFLVSNPNSFRNPHHIPLTKASLVKKLLPQLTKSYDLWHSTHQGLFYRPSRKTKNHIITIHDLNFLFEKSSNKKYLYLNRLQHFVENCQGLTFISEFTKKMVLDNLHVGDVKTEVIYNGFERPTSMIFSRPDFLPKGDFLFTIGAIRSKKNFHVLLPFLKQLKDINLVIAGPHEHPYLGKLNELAKSEGIQNRIFLPGSISDEHKYWLYQHCKAFVFPSLYEGFGFPLVEAMSFGRPVFSSNQTSLPEVGGKNVFYWDNFHPDDMVQTYIRKMSEFENDPVISQNLIKRSKEFTWNNCANKYFQFYNKILGE